MIWLGVDDTVGEAQEWQIVKALLPMLRKEKQRVR